MKLHEFQAKALMAQSGIPVPKGRVATTPAEAAKIATELGGRVVLKAQVYAGGRGKAGGIKVAASPGEAKKIAGELLGKRLVTHQTSPQGVPVSKLLVEEAVDTERELYLSLLIDATSRLPLMMASEAGGMDIEEVARTNPERILRAYIDPAVGFQPFQGRGLAYGMNLAQTQIRPATQLMSSLYHLFMERDCSLAEINPLVVTKKGDLLALDAKLNLDDNALFRHQDLEKLHDQEQDELLEVKAKSYGVKNYVKMSGNIACMVNGAGLAMSVMDLITLAGGRPANFLDIGTLNTTDRVVNAFSLFLSDPDIKAVWINIFGGMARADVIAKGIIEAHQQMDIRTPLVVRLAGTNVEEGWRILRESGLKVVQARDFRDGAEKAVKAAQGEQKS